MPQYFFVGISQFYPSELVNESGLPPSTMKPGMESPSTIQTGQITPWLVLLVIFADMEGGPHLSSSPLSLSASPPLPPSLQCRCPSSAVASLPSPCLPPSATVRHRCPPAPPSLPQPLRAAAAAWRRALLCSAPPRPTEPLHRPIRAARWGSSRRHRRRLTGLLQPPAAQASPAGTPTRTVR